MGTTSDENAANDVDPNSTANQGKNKKKGTEANFCAHMYKYIRIPYVLQGIIQLNKLKRSRQKRS